MEQRLEQARLWMTLAEEKLTVARDLLALSYFDEVISKSYYVMFYAAKAVLFMVGWTCENTPPWCPISVSTL